MGRRPYRDQKAYGRIFGFDERCEEAIQRTMEREHLTRAEIALKLVSSQRGGGWWLIETNAAPTRLAVEILTGL